MRATVLILCALLALVPIARPCIVVDLSLPPEDRWPTEYLNQTYGAELKESLAVIKILIPYVWEENLLQSIGVRYMEDPKLQEYAIEIGSMAQAFNISLSELILLNLIYDFSAACTSIVAETLEGEILHVRNLDFPLAPTLQKIVTDITYVNGSQFLFHSTGFAGMVGVYTGMRPGAFSASIDARLVGNILENFWEVLTNWNALPVSIVLRQVLTDINNYDDAVNVLQQAPLVAPVYYIVGGLNNAVVLTRDRTTSWFPLGLYPPAGHWFTVQTNYPWWEPDPKSDPRRTVAEYVMQEQGRANLTLDLMYNVLITPPVFNNMTIYTALMNPTTGYYNSMVYVS